MLLSIDTETTGVDFRFGGRPFFVTTCTEDGEQQYWEWAVDPLTRQPIIPEEDIAEIYELSVGVHIGNTLVGQNIKFDLTALASIYPDFGTYWPWERTHDTLIAGHLLASNRPHNLTDMAIQYLGIDIEPLEKKLQEACNKARSMCRSQFPEWRVAKKGLPDMPSAGEKCWKYDTWLPRAIAKELNYPEDHPWWTVTSDYANADSSVTVSLWKVQEAEIKRRGLWEIYLERMKLVPIAYDMERRGVTISGERLGELSRRFRSESDRAGRVCVNIASGMGHELVLPKGASPNNSLRKFCFDTLKLPVVGRTDKGDPSLTKGVLEHYETTLPDRSKELLFVKTLRGKRSRDTALAYLESYQSFWIPIGIVNDKGEQLWYRLHPSLNITGTDTLRWSSAQPNSQNISKKEKYTLRYTFGPAPGREWWSLDYENIELRIPAYASGEKAMIELFEHPEEPPYYGSNHLLNFHTVFPDVWDKELKAVGYNKVGPHCKNKYKTSHYQDTKNGGFCKQYGGQKAKTDATFKRRGAYDLIESRFSGLAALTQKMIDLANKYGYVETMPDKTVNPDKGYPLLCTRTDNGRVLPTVPLSYFVQGTAMQCTAKAMIRVAPYLQEISRRERQEHFMTLQVHDELVLDFPKGGKKNLPKVMKVKELMEESGRDIGVPLLAAITYNPVCWSEGEKYED